ncbi:MAG: aspartate peptidase [Parcubacteria group bacterium GW2011_GWC2_45_7]|nr:MAG: aspartate peptidase [Parcubacteria group bacterium GW2011_GWC2_45_7]KKU73993.1 MAG: aspartate peptidase [Parcubacteria group bacterium GW2011_GWA2_47_26]
MVHYRCRTTVMNIIFVIILGLVVGSFLNAYIFRLHRSTTLNPSLHNPLQLPLILRGRDRSPPPLRIRGGEGELRSVWRGRSYCPKCKKPLAWYELIPVLSFILQLRRCRGCKQRIDWQYPVVELSTAVLFVLAYLAQRIMNQAVIHDFLFLIQQLVAWYLLSVLVILFVFDLRYGLVPDRMVLPAIVIAFFSMVILNAVKDPMIPDIDGILRFAQNGTNLYVLLAIAVGAGFFALQYYASKGRWLGAGDIRIGALMGAMLGWPLIIEALVLSYMIGGVVGLLLIATGKKRFGQTVPLGTFLTLGTAITFLYGEQIWHWYWG